jgi:archaellum component FlaC
VDEMLATELAGLGVSLTELAVKGTVTAISTKVKAIKEEKNIESVKAKYDEIINELLSEREEAVRIAQAYKSELEKVVISDEDIEHLHSTVSRILEMIKNLQGNEGEENPQVNEQIQAYEQIKELISVDTLKTMQLLGFNYKYAVGEPLTMFLRNLILSKVQDPDSVNSFKKILTPEMVEILKDETAYQNFKQIMGMEQQ